MPRNKRVTKAQKQREAERRQSSSSNTRKVIAPVLGIFALLLVILLVVGQLFPPSSRVKLLATIGPNVAPEVGTRPQFRFNNGGRFFNYFIFAIGRNDEFLEHQLEFQGFQLDVIGSAVDIYRIPLSFDLDDSNSPRIPLDEQEALELLDSYELVYSSAGEAGRFLLEPSVFNEKWTEFGPGEIKYLSPSDGYGFYVYQETLTTVSTPYRGALTYEFESSGGWANDSPAVLVSTGLGPGGEPGETMKDTLTKDWRFFLLVSEDVHLWRCFEITEQPFENPCNDKQQLYPSATGTEISEPSRVHEPRLVVFKRPNAYPDTPLFSSAMLNSSVESTAASLTVNALSDEPILTRWIPNPPIDKTNFSELETVGLPGKLSVGIRNYEVHASDVVQIEARDPDLAYVTATDETIDNRTMDFRGGQLRAEIVTGYHLDIEAAEGRVRLNGVELKNSPAFLDLLRDQSWQAIEAIAAAASVFLATVSYIKSRQGSE